MSVPAHMQENTTEGTGKLDDLWERQQIKAFTAWCNSHLRTRQRKIENIAEGFLDGVDLLQLIEIVGNAELPKAARGKMRVHKLQNLNNCLTFIKDKGVRLVGIGAEDIADGNLKLTLGMIWTLILRFEIEDISVEASSAKDALMLWCQRKTAPYDNVNIENFHRDWKDGLAFCALIHRHRPDLIDYASLEKGNALENLTLAMTIAERDLGLIPMIEPEDVAISMKPDERSIITQVSAFYKLFASYNKGEIAATKIAAVLRTNQQHDKLIEQFETMASDLLAWIPQAIAQLEDRPELQSEKDCLGQLDRFAPFRSQEVPAKLHEKGELEAHYSSLQTKLRLAGRAPYVPSEGKMIEDINARWSDVEAADVANKAWVVSELQRNQALAHKAKIFASKVSAHEAWTNGKDSLLTSDDYATANLGAVLAMQKKHETFRSDLLSRETAIQEIGELANELHDKGYVHHESTDQQYAAIYATWGELHKMIDARTEALADARARQEKLEELWVDGAKKSSPLAAYLEETKAHLTEPLFCSSLSDVEEERAKLAKIQSSMEGFARDFDAYMDVVSQIESAGAQAGRRQSSVASENPYTFHSTEDMSAGWAALQELIPTREAEINAEQQRQEGRDQLASHWASESGERMRWVESMIAKIEAVTVDTSTDLEGQLAALQALQGEIEGYASSFNAAEAIDKEVQSALIIENSHTTVTMESMRGRWGAMNSTLQATQADIANQITIRDSSNITEEQMSEFRTSFDHFDKDKSGALDALEFRGCLVSLGVDVSATPEGDDAEFVRIMSIVDPNRDGKVSFTEFVAFMSAERADAATKDDLIEQFRLLAQGAEYISAAQLAELPDELAAYCTANMAPFAGGPAGALDYTSFAESCYGDADV